jgi:hypothetical protein
MGFRLQRRVSLAKGTFMNVSGSGLSFTRRTKWGSYGTRGFSIRTGIPGLYYRQRYSKKGDMSGIIVLLVMLAAWIAWILIQAALLVAFIVFKIALICLALIITVSWEVTKWCALTSWDFSKYCFERWQAHLRQRSQPPMIAGSAPGVEIHDEPPDTALETTAIASVGFDGDTQFDSQTCISESGSSGPGSASDR